MSMLQEINEMRARLEALESSLNETEQQWPDGTPGWFWDDYQDNFRFGWCGVNEETKYPFRRYNDPECTRSDIGGHYKNFTPLTEAILPPMIKHDGGEYPGSDKDEVIIHNADGSTEPSRALYIDFTRKEYGGIIGYQVIKEG